MKAILIVRKNMKIFLSDRKGLFISLALPIILASIMGLTFSGFGSGGKRGKLAVAVVDLDRSGQSEKLVKSLEASDDLRVERAEAEKEAADRVREGRIAAALVIRPDAGERMRKLFAGGEKAGFTLHVDPSRMVEVGMLRGILFQKVMERVSESMFDREAAVGNFREAIATLEADAAAKNKEELGGFLKSGIEFFGKMPVSGIAGPGGSDNMGNRLSRPVDFEVVEVTTSKNEEFRGFDMMAQTFAGTSAMFLLFTVLDGALAFIRERQRKTLSRLLAAPVSRSSIMLGECGSYMVIALAQLVLLFSFAKIVFGIPLSSSPPLIALVALSTCWAAAGFGIFIASIGRTEKQVQGISMLAILVMSALGGSMVPVWFMPDFMKTASNFTMTKWAVRGFEAVTWRGLDFAQVAPDAAVLLGMGTVLFALSLALGRLDSEC